MANIRGTAANNNLVGTTGNDVINGLGGADTMAGGLGNDVYVVDDIGDIVIENAGAGIDTVQANINYMLTANVENLQLTGTANINGTGNILNNSLTGNSGNNILDGGAGVDTMAGGQGNDTYIVDNVGDVVTEANNQGTDNVQASVNYTLAANIENLALIGAALIGTGNTLNNTITGNSANNTLSGGAGVDTLIGGLGDDTYIVDNAGDVVTELAGGGIDSVQASASYVLGANVENLTLTGIANINGTGNALDNIITGNNGNNTLNGGAGNDTLNGGAGIDSLIGGTGNDTYIVDNAGDTITELVGEGTDTAQASVSYTLGATNIENLILTGTGNINGTGNTLDNVITGNSGNNLLNGGAGNDTLIGGLGLDTMIGGTGNDTFIVDNAGDVVTEAAGAGTDTAQASVSYVIGANVENLILTGTANINGTGNATNNTITGNSGNNILDGAAGADTLIGGLGDDTYIVDNAGDVITEAAGEGADTVQTSASYILGNELENLTLTGTANINGTGNALDNVITGNSGDNILDGAAGADILSGGLGDDIYIVDIGDTVLEYGALAGVAGGIDTVIASMDYVLSDVEFGKIENLMLIGAATVGTGNEFDNTITGNALDNVLDGAAGNDTLDGAGGSDILLGGFGDDTYIVNDTSALIIEGIEEGYDTVVSTVDYALGADVENLTLVGIDAINGTGNELNNVIIGNAADNIINGGAGNDYLSGGAGNDTYVVDSIYDAVIEKANEGLDTVESSVSYQLWDHPENGREMAIENLTLTGELSINGTGNELNNIITGNSAGNILNGGIGADTMIGGAGGDTYVVDDVNDVVVEDVVVVAVDLVVLQPVSQTPRYEFLLQQDSNFNTNLFLKDNQTQNIVPVSADENGNLALGSNVFRGFDVTHDGRYSVFQTIANNLIQGDSDSRYDLFLKDLQTGAIIKVNTDSQGNSVLNYPINSPLTQYGTPNTYVYDNPTVSLDGRYVVFTSDNPNLIAGLTSGLNVFKKDILTNEITVLNQDLQGNYLDASRVGFSFDSNIIYFYNSFKNLDTGVTLDLSSLVPAGYNYSTGFYTVSPSLRHVALLLDSVSATTFLIYDTVTQTSSIIHPSNGLLNIEGSWSFELNDDGSLVYLSTDNQYRVINVSAGKDIVQSSVDYTLGANVENLELTGAAIIATGNELDNQIRGNAQDNVINGAAGNDTMIGGAGNDTYIYNFGDGLDTINDADGLGSIIYRDADGIEHVLTGSEQPPLAGVYVDSTGRFTYTFNGSDQTLSINLDGQASIVLQNYDFATNSLGITFTNPYIFGTPFNDFLIGTDGNDIIYGGLGVDTLNGGDGDDTLIAAPFELTNGSSGIDYLAGGLGNDTYILSDGIESLYFHDYYFFGHITEAADEGIDTILSDFTVNLANFANIENLTLQDFTLQEYNDSKNAIGNSLDNVLIGNSVNNYIAGGAGNDTLTGGAGSDVFGLANSLASLDTITDFVSGVDRLEFSSLSYLSYGSLQLTEFVAGAGVISGNGTAQVIYDTSTGYLYYEDGLNADAAVHVATLIGMPTLSESDFYMFPQF